MVIRIYSPDELEQYFEERNRNYFSHEAYGFLLDYYDKDFELDVTKTCSVWTEYGPMVDDVGYDAFIADYGYIYNIEDWVRDTYPEYEDADADEITIEIENEYIDKDNYVYDLAEAVELELDGDLYSLENGDYLIFKL